MDAFWRYAGIIRLDLDWRIHWLEPHMTPSQIRELARTIWQYHQLNHQLALADAILVLCSHDTAVAGRGAELLLAGWAPLLIFSGGLGAITRHLWHEAEADTFARIAIEM